MSVIVKSTDKSTNEFKVLTEGTMKSVMIKSGRNILDESVYESLKGHDGFVSFVNRDVITINTEGAIAKKAADKPDFTYAEGLIGQEDGKDVLKEYALAWSINLNKKNSIANMLADFKEQYEVK